MEVTVMPPLKPVGYSDDALAFDFTSLYKDDLRFVTAWGQWFVWDGVSWRREETGLVSNLVRDFCRSASSHCLNRREASRISSARTIAAIERLAQSDRRHSATTDQWDRNLWLLNTPAGVVDLRTGKLRPAEREDYMTKITAVAAGGDCPLWLSFLARITNDSKEFQDYIQRMCGYVLTGTTSEHALFFLYGTGANGKSVFLNTISGAMGGYARAAPIATFTASTFESHPTDLAGLQGARLVTATEPDSGQRWNESRIKLVTGGDPISARFMRQNFVEYLPQF